MPPQGGSGLPRSNATRQRGRGITTPSLTLRVTKGRRINNCRSRSRQTSDLNSGEFSYIRQLFLRRPLVTRSVSEGVVIARPR